MATMVSSVLNIARLPQRISRLKAGAVYRSESAAGSIYFFEMITVFKNASPMLSDDIAGSSATVR